jgi:hypothetical protein
MIAKTFPILFASGVAILSMSAAAEPAFAAAHYRAEPAAAPMADRFVLRDLVWTRSGGAFEAGQSKSQPRTVCASLAKQVGALKSFSIGGTPVSSGDLEKCNARAGS